MALAGILRQSTAVNVIVGPFVDSTNGDDEEIGLTIAQADVRLSKNAGADAQKSDVTSCAHEGDGLYMCELDATDTNTVGILTLWIHVAGALLVRHDYQIVEEAVYDIHYAASATGAVPVASIAANAITASAIATGALDADATAADFLAEINAEVVDALATDTYAQPGQELPAATTSLALMLRYLYKAWRNQVTQDATTYKLYADDATTVDQKATISDDAVTFTKGEVASGP